MVVIIRLRLNVIFCDEIFVRGSGIQAEHTYYGLLIFGFNFSFRTSSCAQQLDLTHGHSLKRMARMFADKFSERWMPIKPIKQ